MADFIGTQNVNVFPSSYRMVKGDGKFTSEQNFANIILSIVDKNSYVIKHEGNVLTIVIKGYLFEIESYVPVANDWFGIGIQDSGGNALVNYNDGSTTMDDPSGSGKFYGLYHISSTTQPTPPAVSGISYYYLKVTNDSGNIINKFKFDATSVKIDGAELSVEDELHNKQYNIKAVDDTIYTGLSGIDGVNDITNVRGTNLIRINQEEITKLNGLEDKGSVKKAVYFDANGVAHDDMNQCGEVYNIADSRFAKSTSIVIDANHEFANGFTMYASKQNPTDGIGKNGDFWLKYSG